MRMLIHAFKMRGWCVRPRRTKRINLKSTETLKNSSICPINYTGDIDDDDMSEFMKGGIKIRTMNDAYNDIKDQDMTLKTTNS